MNLMSDLIAYLRDLLVFKVKPDALNEDVDLDLQKSLAAQAKLLETDRLLELIDQFAEAETRMKWAPNKKLHFEVALIKAIQSLSQVTLNEVIEKLGALRDGKAVAGIGDAGRHDESRTGNAGITDPGYNKADRGTGVSDPGYSNKIAPRVAETEPDNANELWRKILSKIPQKGFLRTLTESVAPIGVDGRNFLLGHPPDEKSAIEAIASPNNRRQLEALLKETSGRDWSVKFVAKEGMELRQAADLEPMKTAESFKDDPLIQEALEMFKGEIKS